MPPKKPTSTAELPPGISLTTYGTYRARWRNTAGKEENETFKRLQDAKAKLEAVKTDVRRGTHVDATNGRVTVRRYADEWLARSMNLGDGGRETYRRDLDRYIIPALGDVRLGRLHDVMISDFLSGELEDGMAASSVHRHYRTLHRMLEVAVLSGRLSTNPCGRVTPPRLDRTEMHFLTLEEVLVLADAIAPQTRKGDRPSRYRAWVLMAALGGPRWSEGRGLRRSNVNGARISIVEQLVRRDDGAWQRCEPKTKKGRRTIALPEIAADAMDLHLDTWAQPGPDGLVFPNQRGNALTSSSFTGNVFKPALVRAGLNPAIRIHDLRHTAVALAIRAGAHPKAIQARMGHSSISVTLDRYGHLYPEMDGEIADGLDVLVSAATKPASAPAVEAGQPADVAQAA
jgi:integrase